MAESLEIRSEMLEAGYKESEEKPDIIIINSCAVTEKAEKEVRQFIRRKEREFPRAKIIVTGCAGTKWENEKTNIPEINLLVNNKEKEKLTTILKSERVKEQESKSTDNIYEKSGRSLIKIQDGCNQFCTYCIVPYLRGKSKSKNTEEIIKEIKSFDCAQGIEIILTAINTDLFGIDKGENLGDLVDKILQETEIERLSFGSINPNSITPKLLKLFKSLRVTKYFHIPIQSGSDRILKLMNRNYEVKDVKGKLEEIKELSELTLIGTDIIVGFPGETDEDFQQTYKFLKDSPISKIHIFRFSKREGTAACKLVEKFGDVPETIKKQRARELEDLGKRKYQEFLEKHLNKTFKALLLVKKEGKYQEALLENNIPVWIETDKDLAGQIKKVKIEKIKNEFVYGRLE